MSVTITGLRSSKGQILACLTTRADAFPDCAGDPAAKHLAVPVSAAANLDFGPVAPGHYAISVIHDENGNGRLDKRLIVPIEGYGFSNDAAVMMGPPRFTSAAFVVGSQSEHLTIRMRYLF